MQKRKIESVLVEWKTSESKKPLVIKGIRQCGKACIVQKNAKENYESVVYMNFILEPYKKSGRGQWAFFLIAFSDLAGTLTQDLRNRNPTLYTTKLRGLYNVKSENGNRKTTLNGERVSGIDFRFPFSPFRFFISCFA